MPALRLRFLRPDFCYPKGDRRVHLHFLELYLLWKTCRPLGAFKATVSRSKDTEHRRWWCEGDSAPRIPELIAEILGVQLSRARPLRFGIRH